MANYLRMTEYEYRQHLRRFGQTQSADSSPLRAPDLEPDPKAKSKRQNPNKEVHPRYRVHVHSRRRRLTDSDGCSIKAVVDALVVGRLLRDDSVQWIPKTPTQSQEKSDVEETVIEVWELK